MIINAWDHGSAFEKRFSPELDPYYDEIYISNKVVEDVVIQKTLDIDRIAKYPDGRYVKIEEKFGNDWHNNKLFVEEIQNTNYSAKETGWIYKCRADELLYCWVDALNKTIIINHLDFPKFQEWYFINQTTFQDWTCSDFNTRPYGRFVWNQAIPKDIYIKDVTILNI